MRVGGCFKQLPFKLMLPQNQNAIFISVVKCDGSKNRKERKEFFVKQCYTN